jgi:hypothetical protein
MVDHYTIPKRGERQKEKAQHWPKEGVEDTRKPVGEKPKDYNNYPGKKKCDHSEETRHGRYFLVLINVRKGKRYFQKLKLTRVLT